MCVFLYLFLGTVVIHLPQLSFQPPTPQHTMLADTGPEPEAKTHTHETGIIHGITCIFHIAKAW